MSTVPQKPAVLHIPEPFVGERIILRTFRDDDAEALYASVERSRDHLKTYMPWAREPDSLDLRRAYIRRAQAGNLNVDTDIVFGIFDLADGRFLGGCGLHRIVWEVPLFEIGYWVDVQEEGKGYVGEAVQLLTRWAFEGLGAKRVEIRCDALNARSRAVALRAGFRLEAVMVNARRNVEGALGDTVVFARFG